MKNKTYTQLSLILDHLFIKSKDLAAAIHVDAAMVSRWRTGKRPISSHSEHYANIIDFILRWDERMEYRNIITFLTGYYPDKSYADRKDVYSAIDMWLSSQNTSSSSSSFISTPASQPVNVQLNVLDTTKQKKNAMLYLLDMALSLTGNRNLYILLDTFADRLLSEESFYTEWIERLKQVTAKGITVHFIYSSYFFSSSIINMDNFLKLCFSPNYHAYYMQKNSGYPFMLCVLEESMAITNFVQIQDENSSSFFTFSDKSLLYRFQHYYKKKLENCQPFTNYYNYPDSFLDYIDISADHSRKLCCYDSTPFLFPIPPEDFREILDYNNFDRNKKDLIMKRYMSIIYEPFMNADNMLTHNLILDINEMGRLLADADYMSMSRILTDDEIIIPRRFFTKYVSRIHDFIKDNASKSNPPFDIFFVTQRDKSLPKSTSIFSIDGLLAHVHSYSLDKYMMFTNPSIASDIYRYMKEIWSKLPEENHYTKSSLLLLKRLLNIVS